MPAQTIRLSTLLPVTPQRLFDAWLDAKGHAAMTGSRATVESREIGGRFTAWDGYIEGTHVALEPGRRIFQSWRASDFPRDAPESYLEVTFTEAPGGTRVDVRHTEVPAKLAAGLLKGWKEFYFKPMAKYFGGVAKRAAAPAKKAARKASPRRKAPPRAPAKRKASPKKAPQRKPRR